MLKTMRHWTGMILAILAVSLPMKRATAADHQDVTITVTPTATVSITLGGTTSYAFGNLNVNTSSVTATALTLTNNGDVAVTVDKQITAQSNPAGWTAGTSAGLDTYVLYAATSTARLNLSDFGSATQFGLQSAVTPLTGPLGTQPTLPPTGTGQSVSLWFRLDMPTQISSQQGRAITVRFTGTAQ